MGRCLQPQTWTGQRAFSEKATHRPLRPAMFVPDGCVDCVPRPDQVAKQPNRIKSRRGHILVHGVDMSHASMLKARRAHQKAKKQIARKAKETKRLAKAAAAG